jgi:hypothetical protein
MIYKKKILDVGDRVIIKDEDRGLIRHINSAPPPDDPLRGVIVQVDYGFPTHMPGDIWGRSLDAKIPGDSSCVRYLVEVNKGRNPWTWYGEHMVDEDPEVAIMNKIKEAGDD